MTTEEYAHNDSTPETLDDDIDVLPEIDLAPEALFERFGLGQSEAEPVLPVETPVSPERPQEPHPMAFMPLARVSPMVVSS